MIFFYWDYHEKSTLSRNKIWYRLYSDIWTKLPVQAPDKTWDEDLLPFKKAHFFPLYVENVDGIFNPHPQIPHMRIIRIFCIRMANPNNNGDNSDDGDDWLYLWIDLIGEVVNGGVTWIRVKYKHNVQCFPLLLKL